MTRGTYLTVEPQEDDHDEEEGGPQRRERHHAHSARVRNEGQAGTYGGIHKHIMFSSFSLSVECTGGKKASPDTATSEIGTFCS